MRPGRPALRLALALGLAGVALASAAPPEESAATGTPALIERATVEMVLI